MKDNFDVHDYLREIFFSRGKSYQIWNFFRNIVTIDIKWGDRKHDHLFVENLMKELGYEHIKEIIIEKDGSDTYSASHEFELRLEEKINDGMEIIKGQDHCYWIYDNYRDLYYPTGVSWNKISEQEFIDKFNKIGFTLYGNNWIDPDFDV